MQFVQRRPPLTPSLGVPLNLAAVVPNAIHGSSMALKGFGRGPANPGNIWVNLIHDWDQEARDRYLSDRAIPINPVAKALCRSGECMCGTMQAAAERVEAAALYPAWGANLDLLEAEARRLHGFGWGENFPKPRDTRQGDMFQPMCNDCPKRAA